MHAWDDRKYHNRFPVWRLGEYVNSLMFALKKCGHYVAHVNCSSTIRIKRGYLYEIPVVSSRVDTLSVPSSNLEYPLDMTSKCLQCVHLCGNKYHNSRSHSQNKFDLWITS